MYVTYLGECEAFVPYSFPPALSDADRNLQAAHLDAARGISGSDKALAHAMQTAVQEELGQHAAGFAELDENDVAATLSRAGALVREALEALRAEQLRIKEAEEAAAKKAARKAQLELEWARREQWVQQQAVTKPHRHGPKKGKNRVRSTSKPESIDSNTIQKVVAAAVERVDRRSEGHRRTAQAIAALEDSGLCRLSWEEESRPEEKEHQLLDERRHPCAVLPGEYIVELTPHRIRSNRLEAAARRLDRGVRERPRSFGAVNSFGAVMQILKMSVLLMTWLVDRHSPTERTRSREGLFIMHSCEWIPVGWV